jgi:hypothetical protein
MRNQKKSDSGDACPEFVVGWETIRSFFSPPLPRSTFHDYVNKGIIIPMKLIRGRYLLNESLLRLGLRQVARLPADQTKRSMNDIVRLACHFAEPTLFPLPSWIVDEDGLEFRDVDHARHLAEEIRDELLALPSAAEKLAFAEGACGAYADLSKRCEQAEIPAC